MADTEGNPAREAGWQATARRTYARHVRIDRVNPGAQTSEPLRQAPVAAPDLENSPAPPVRDPSQGVDFIPLGIDPEGHAGPPWNDFLPPYYG